MDFLERVLPLAAVFISAVAPIVVAIISNSKKDRKASKENSDKLCSSVDAVTESVKSMDGKIEVLEHQVRENHRRLLVMEIMEEELPMEARLDAGRKYIAEGWNGAIKAKVEVMEFEYKEELKGTGK